METCPVNIAGAGDLHPSVWIPVERCEAGKNHVASKERLLIGTRRPIEPRHGMPQRSQELPIGVKRWVWTPLLHITVGALGLLAGADDPSRAALLFSRCTASDVDGSDDEDEDGQEPS